MVKSRKIYIRDKQKLTDVRKCDKPSSASTWWWW